MGEGWQKLTVLAVTLLMAATGCAEKYFREAEAPPAPVQHQLPAWPYHDYWTGVVFNGEKVGLMHLAVIPPAGDEPLFELRSEAALAFHFLGFDKHVTLKARDWVSEDLRLARFAHDYDLDGNIMTLHGTVAGGQLLIERVDGGKTNLDTIVVTDAIYPTSAVALYPTVHGLEVGRRYDYAVYDGQRQQVEPVSQTIEAYQESDLYAGRAFRIETSMGGQQSTLWINERAEPVLERAWRGLLFSTLESEQQAKTYLAFASVNKREVLVELSRIRVDVPIPQPRDVTAMQVALRGLPDSFVVPSDALQQCARENDETRCGIQRADPSVTRTGAVLPDDALKPYVQPTAAVDSVDPQVRTAARDIAKGVTEPLSRIKALVGWIQQNMEQVPVDAFSSSDVLRERKGECQGLTWLYAAFARSLGIPTRVVNGLVYSKDLDGFLYHTWAESYLEGWLPVDPTFGQVGADATHIKLLEGDRLADLLPLTDIVGKIQLKILSLQPS